MKIKFKDINTASNYISFFRILLAIPIFYFLDRIHDDYSVRYILVSLFFLGYLTDIADGFLARKLNQITEVGKIIDPLADKALIILIAVKLYMINEIPDHYFYTIVLRDLIIFVGGIFVSKKIGKVLPSNLLGKITVVSIGFYIIAVVLDAREIPLLYYSLKYLSLGLSVASVIGYGIRAKESIRWYKNETI